MLIYITNRKLTNIPKDASAFNTIDEVGIKLNKKRNASGDAIFCGISNKSYTKVEFFPRGKELDLFDKVDVGEYSKPWLVLLHGYHQDAKETIAKAKFLVDNHGVNVVLFSWPSRPNPVKSFNTKSLEDYIKDYIKSVLFKFGRPSLLTLFVGELKKWLEDYVSNYVPARNNAEASAGDFYSALSILNEHLLPRLQGKKISMVVHSMGNYLLENTIINKNGLPITFKNIILHQADVNSSNHANWTPRLSNHITNKLYVTINIFDYVLAASNILHRYKLNKKNVERLGQSVRIKPDGVYQGYIHNIVDYLDFTDGYGVDEKHEIFTCKGVSIDNNWISAGKNNIDISIFNLLGKIFRSETKDGLPTKKGGALNGISKMKTLPNVFKPEWIVEDESLSEEHEDISFIYSLEHFTDPYKPEHVDDPDLDD